MKSIVKPSAKASLESAVRAALAKLTADSIEKIALEKALAAFSAPKAPRGDRTHKYDVCVHTHDEHCYCEECAPAKIAAGIAEHKRLLEAGLVEVWSYAEAFGKVEEPKRTRRRARNLKEAVDDTPVTDRPFAAAEDALSHCACSHAADRHASDEMGNLLKCADCSCDHFRMKHVNGDASGRPEDPVLSDVDTCPPCDACARGEHCQGHDDECVCDCRWKREAAASC